MENPWRDLPDSPPYVLPMDDDALKKLRDIQAEALPVPYVGSPAHAELYLLLLNPGQAGDAEMRSAYAAEQNRRGLTFESKYPFWSLDPGLAGTGGYEWWTPRLRVLAAEVGWDLVRERVMCVQYFPYHSRTFSAGAARPPSQKFAFQIIKAAIAKNKAIVIGRGRELWTRAVPALATYSVHELRNPRAVFLSPGNMQPGAFEELAGHLRTR